MRKYSVREITQVIQALFTAEPKLVDLWVIGEISNLAKSRSGHWYFRLKDADAQLRCVMFRREARRVRGDVLTGQEVLVHGRVGVYGARGEYQMVVDALELAGGAGDLHLQLEALKAKLQAEGLFDQERKRPIPAIPRRIGVVSSPAAAAWQDVQKVLRRRYPLVEILFSPTLVQGQDAPWQIVGALDRLEREGDIDVILIVRGGGSLEDLWCFNDEAVARRIARCAVPIISGIGHEVDFTLADFAADKRAPTPSAAAELATPNRDDLRLHVDQLQQRIDGRMAAALQERRSGLQQLRGNLQFLSPRKPLQQAQAAVSDQRARLERVAQGHLLQKRERLESQRRALSAADPRQILARGYALVQDERGVYIRRAQQVRAGQGLRVQVAEGQFRVKVDDVG